jgi:DNA-binding CsgD family transcriptional regulator
MNSEHRLARLSKPAPSRVRTDRRLRASTGPLGDPQLSTFDLQSFDREEVVALSLDTIPAWQRDTDRIDTATQAKVHERQAVLRACDLFGRVGVIFDRSAFIHHGTRGWSHHLAQLPVFLAGRAALTPISSESQQDLWRGLAALFTDPEIPYVPIALRDLDGWVCDVLCLKRVGPANPDYAYAVLPKSTANRAARIANHTRFLGLTEIEGSLVTLIAEGKNSKEMASALKLKQGEVRRHVEAITAKFQVRHKSELARLVTTIL